MIRVAALRERLSALATPAEQERAGLEHALTLLETLAPELDGVYLITPGNRWRCLLPLLDHVRALRA